MIAPQSRTTKGAAAMTCKHCKGKKCTGKCKKKGKKKKK
jgi:hypothetical protein